MNLISHNALFPRPCVGFILPMSEGGLVIREIPAELVRMYFDSVSPEDTVICWNPETYTDFRIMFNVLREGYPSLELEDFILFNTALSIGSRCGQPWPICCLLAHKNLYGDSVIFEDEGDSDDTSFRRGLSR